MMQLELDYFLLDVFTDTPFGGNPLAVFPDADELSDEAMLKITQELNLSETVFLHRPSSHSADIGMRIFTPGKELPTAGHPTIGTAFILLQGNLLTPKNKGALILEQKIGSIKVFYNQDTEGGYNIHMEQPLPVFEQTFNDKELIANLLGLNASELYDSFPCRIVNCGNPFLLIPIQKLSSVQKIK